MIAGRLDEAFRNTPGRRRHHERQYPAQYLFNVMRRRELTGYFANNGLLSVWLSSGNDKYFYFYLGNFTREVRPGSVLFRFHPWLYLFLVPASMRLWLK
jgi:hypothetical protein